MATSSEVRPNVGADVYQPPAVTDKPAGLPVGKYKILGWDVELTGRRLMDEICQIAAYSPRKSFNQYIMPFGELNPSARRRHSVRIVTIGRFRLLKDEKTHKVLKTKSEPAALRQFLDYLEFQKGDADGVILVYHEPRRLNPTMLIQALLKHGLLDRFQSLVAGFTDNYALAFEKCKDTMQSVSLRTLAQLLLDDGEKKINNASDRARAAYKILERLAQGGQLEAAASSGLVHPTLEMIILACQWARPLTTEIAALDTLKDQLEKQNTFRPIFAPLLRTTRQERRRYTFLRRQLADAGLLFDQLKEAWQIDQKIGLEFMMSPVLLTIKEKDFRELINIFDCYFDPDKEWPPTWLRSKNQDEPPPKIIDLTTSDEECAASLSPSMSCSGDLSAATSSSFADMDLLKSEDLEED